MVLSKIIDDLEQSVKLSLSGFFKPESVDMVVKNMRDWTKLTELKDKDLAELIPPCIVNMWGELSEDARYIVFVMCLIKTRASVEESLVCRIEGSADLAPGVSVH